jgi:PAS domain S-box-containing protein
MKRWAWIGISLFLVVVCGYLLPRTWIDIAQHSAYQKALRDARQYDGRIDEATMRMRLGLDPDEDWIAALSADLAEAHQALEKPPRFLSAESAGEIRRLVGESRDLAKKKAAIIERFSQRHRTLSAAFTELPELVASTANHLTTSVSDRSLLQELLQDTLSFDLNPSKVGEERVRQTLTSLEAAGEIPQLEAISEKVRTILAEKPAVDRSLREITKQPTAALFDRMQVLYENAFQAASQKAEVVRTVLYAVALVLLAATFFLVVRHLRAGESALRAAKAETDAALKATKIAEEKYRRIFEQADEGIFQSSPDGHFLSANPALARIYGYDSPAELAKSVTNIATDLYANAERREQFAAALRERDELHDFESAVRRKDGSIAWVSESAHAIRDDFGMVRYYEGLVTDITERKRAEEEAARERERAEKLLLNILPGSIAQRLRTGEALIADRFSEATVLFADIAGFTQMAAGIDPDEVVAFLNRVFSAFDELADKHGLEKIKTIGDAYMAVAGVPQPRADHCEAVANMALDMMERTNELSLSSPNSFNMRIGINTGPVVAGVIGIRKFIYDLWGDTVNIASRMESHGVSGNIQVTGAVFRKLRDRYTFAERGEIEVKGRGRLPTWILTGRVT